MGINFKEFWSCLADYPRMLKYYIVDTDEEGRLTFTDEMDKFAAHQADSTITDIVIYQHDGGFALTLYIRSEKGENNA